MLAAVYKAAELRALVRNLAQGRKRKHLKSSAVGQDCAVPVHKFMQAPRPLYQLVTGTEVQVVCIGQQYLRARRLDLLGSKSFDRSLCAYGHKAGSVYNAVLGVQPAYSRARLFVLVYKFKSHIITLYPYILN